MTLDKEQIGIINSYDKEEMRLFIRDIFSGNTRFAFSPGLNVKRSEILKSIFSDLKGDSRVVIQQCLLTFLEDLIYSERNKKEVDLGSELFDSCGLMLFDSYRFQAISLLKNVALKPEKFFSKVVLSKERFHLDALRILLKWKETLSISNWLSIDSWRKAFYKSEWCTEYSTTIMKGLVKNDLKMFFDWLSKTEVSECTLNSYAYLLPTFENIEQYEDYFERKKSNLSSQIVELTKDYFHKVEMYKYVDKLPSPEDAIRKEKDQISNASSPASVTKAYKPKDLNDQIDEDNKDRVKEVEALF